MPIQKLQFLHRIDTVMDACLFIEFIDLPSIQKNVCVVLNWHAALLPSDIHFYSPSFLRRW